MADYTTISIPTRDKLGRKKGENRYLNHPAWGLENVFIKENDIPFIKIEKLKRLLKSKTILDGIMDFYPVIVLVKRGATACVHPYPAILNGCQCVVLFYAN